MLVHRARTRTTTRRLRNNFSRPPLTRNCRDSYLAAVLSTAARFDLSIIDSKIDARASQLQSC